MTMIKVLLLIAGGAVGTVCRYYLSGWVQQSTSSAFPYGIFTVNIVGSLVIGICWGVSEQYNISPHYRLFIFTGLLGGFTTFSSFMLDTMALFKTGDYKTALMYILTSNIFGILAVFLGYIIGKSVCSLAK